MPVPIPKNGFGVPQVVDGIGRRARKRRGMAAETVIRSIDDARGYDAFEAALMAHYAPRSEPTRELVYRLASLLWRLRRTTAIESGLLEIQRDILHDRMAEGPQADDQSNSVLVQTLKPRRSESLRCLTACCFLRAANLPNGILERLGRYEARLWRQARDTVAVLELLKRG
jgi:hypothetical protein